MATKIECCETVIAHGEFFRCWFFVRSLTQDMEMERLVVLGWRVGWRIATRSFYWKSVISKTHFPLQKSCRWRSLLRKIVTMVNQPLACVGGSSCQHYQDQETKVWRACLAGREKRVHPKLRSERCQPSPRPQSCCNWNQGDKIWWEPTYTSWWWTSYRQTNPAEKSRISWGGGISDGCWE